MKDETMTIHRFYRAIKALAVKAGPLGVLPRTVVARMEVSIEYRAQGAQTRPNTIVVWTADIEGIGCAVDRDPQIAISDLRKRIACKIGNGE